MKTVLHITGNTAHWICIKRGVIVDAYEEPIEIDSQRVYQPCRWKSKKHLQVHLLLDCEQTEINVHPLSDIGTRWNYRSNKLALQKRLIERFPDSIVRTAQNAVKLGAALVHHINYSADVDHWLRVSEKHGIVICSVTTVAEVLAHNWSVDGDSIIVSRTSEYTRHTYCRSGHALFTRAINCSSSNEFLNQFNQTVDYLKSCDLIEAPVPACTLGIEENPAQSLTSTELVSELNVIDAKQSVPLMLALKLIGSATIRTNHSNRRVSFALQAYQRQRAGKRQLRLSLALAALVIASSGFAAFNERKRANDYEQFRLHRAELMSAIDAYQSQANQLGADSIPLSNALIEKMEVESVLAVSPAILLTVIAQAFTAHRELELDELHWAVVDDQNLAHRDVIDEGIATDPSGRIVPPESTTLASIMKVRLQGTINKGDSLREQQDAFNAFTRYLESQQELRNLTIIQTPLMQFDTTVSVSNAQSLNKPQFKLQFDLHRLFDNES